MKYTQFHRNEKLKTIKKDWIGNPNKRGKFQNLSFHKKAGISNIFKLRYRRNPDRHIKKAEKWNPYHTKITSLEHIEEDSLMWLGHNSFFMQLDGKRFLFDPVFGHIPFVRRKSVFPAQVTAFSDIDYILISHDHYDHLDKKSIKIIVRHSPDVKIICGLGLKKLLERWTRKSVEIIEAGWYQQYNDASIKVTFLPCRHWGKRGVNDGSVRLWGAYMVQSAKLNIYYSGDTVYGDHFGEVPGLFGNPDYAIIGIGAYKPRWFMEPNHISPYDAVRAAKDMGAKVAIPMHYGTFDLSNEPLSDPPVVFENTAQTENQRVYIPHLGETVEL
ncbi:MAG: MBL fold metallo-hydrolase [Rikenellaceae bacterium]